jgi:hypothetical protein
MRSEDNGTVINIDSRILSKFLAAEEIIKPNDADCYQRSFGIKEIKNDEPSQLLFSKLYSKNYEYKLELLVTYRKH